jgi:hypothetical protein
MIQLVIYLIKNCSVKCGFSNNHVSSNDDNPVKLNEDEVDEWQFPNSSSAV